MATKIATITATIEEEEGVVVTKSIEIEYDNSTDHTITDIDFEYTTEASGGPVLRPKSPR